tara:strand:+ start:731 stop:1018 length:288 start_codon:yes stop_codon:yes gene_type:complete
MKNLVSIEKKNFIKKEYVEEKNIMCEYDLVMDLLDDSLFEQGDIKEMIEVCKYVFSNLYNNCIGIKKDSQDLFIKQNVIESHNDWVENNYANDWA